MASIQSLPSVDYLRKRLRYEPETGKLFWLDYKGIANKWRARWAGKEAFTARTTKGYRVGKIDGVRFNAHRVAYAIHHGESPDGFIDHINGVKDDNRINNIRVVSNQDNARNASRRSDNTSGITGVSWYKRSSKWKASITLDNRSKHLGFFDTIEEAAAARKEAATKHGFTERHGTKAEAVQ